MRHVPVLLNEVIDSLQLKPGMTVMDCTVGDAGHAETMLNKISPEGKLLAIDADPESLLRAKQYLYSFGERVIYIRENFSKLKKIVAENNFGLVSAILMDLGWSSPQFEERGRGFSFLNNEPLDMRYDLNCHSEAVAEESSDFKGDTSSRSASRGTSELRMTGCETAADIINTYDFDDLYRIFRMYGEEDLSKEIAEAIVEARNQKIKKSKNQIETTKELVDIILEVYRKKLGTDKEVPWVGGIHPATKVFQALRIEVNHEFEVLKQALPQAVELLSAGGRLAVITFHSLEDRVVKHYFQTLEGKTITLVNKKPIIASEEEVKNNPRSRSAKLRVVQKM